MLQVRENKISLCNCSGGPEEMPHVTVTITKNASLWAKARYISITTIYSAGYLQIFNAGRFFSSKHCRDIYCHGFQGNHKLWLFLLSNQGRT